MHAFRLVLTVALALPFTTVAQVQDGTYSGSLSCGPLLTDSSRGGWTAPLKFEISGEVVNWIRGDDTYSETGKARFAGNQFSIDAIGSFKTGAAQSGTWRTSGIVRLEGTGFIGQVQTTNPARTQVYRSCIVWAPVRRVEAVKLPIPPNPPVAVIAEAEPETKVASNPPVEVVAEAEPKTNLSIQQRPTPNPDQSGKSVPEVKLLQPPVASASKSILTASAPSGATAVSVATSAPAVLQQTPQVRRIQFAQGATSGIVENALVRGEFDRYSIDVKQGQYLALTVTSSEDNAVFDVYPPNTNFDGASLTKSEALLNAKEQKGYTGQLQQSGSYSIVVGGTRGNTQYKLTASVSDAAPPAKVIVPAAGVAISSQAVQTAASSPVEQRQQVASPGTVEATFFDQSKMVMLLIALVALASLGGIGFAVVKNRRSNGQNTSDTIHAADTEKSNHERNRPTTVASPSASPFETAMRSEEVDTQSAQRALTPASQAAKVSSATASSQHKLFCAQCGAQQPVEARFCAKCGAKHEGKDSVQGSLAAPLVPTLPPTIGKSSATLATIPAIGQAEPTANKRTSKEQLKQVALATLVVGVAIVGKEWLWPKFNVESVDAQMSKGETAPTVSAVLTEVPKGTTEQVSKQSAHSFTPEQIKQVRDTAYPEGFPIAQWWKMGFGVDTRTRIFVYVDNFSRPTRCTVEQVGILSTTGAVHEIPKLALIYEVVFPSMKARTNLDTSEGIFHVVSLEGAQASLRFSFDGDKDHIELKPNSANRARDEVWTNTVKLSRFKSAATMKVLHYVDKGIETAFTYDLVAMHKAVALAKAACL